MKEAVAKLIGNISRNYMYECGLNEYEVLSCEEFHKQFAIQESDVE